MNKITTFFDSRKDIGLVILRVFLGLRLFYGVVDNVISWDSMMEFSKFLAAFHFPFPVVSAVLSVYIQLFSAILFLVGYQVRVASILMTLNFLVALIFVHFPNGDSIELMTPALAMLFGSLTLLFTGGGEKYRLRA